MPRQIERFEGTKRTNEREGERRFITRQTNYLLRGDDEGAVKVVTCELPSRCKETTNLYNIAPHY